MAKRKGLLKRALAALDRRLFPEPKGPSHADNLAMVERAAKLFRTQHMQEDMELGMHAGIQELRFAMVRDGREELKPAVKWIESQWPEIIAERRYSRITEIDKTIS